MRHPLVIAASLVVIGFASNVLAGSTKDAAYDKNDGPVIDSRGNCVRTMWQDASDPCAAPEPKKVAAPAPKPAPAPAPAPVVSNEQRSIYFDFNKAALTPAATAKLDQLAKIINDSSEITDVTIHGFTDQIGTDSYNAALADKRVAAVKSYLDEKSRLKSGGDIRGLGKAAPEADCAGVTKRIAKIACMAKERRVEVEFNAQQ